MSRVRPQLTEAEIEAARQGVVRAARRYGGRLSTEEVEDLTQTALLRFLERAGSSRLESRAGYLRRIGLSCFVDLVRYERAARRDVSATTSIEGLDFPGDEGPERRYGDREEVEHLLDQCRCVLSPRHFKVFLLAQVLGLSGAETAAACEISLTNVHSIVSRARQRLKQAGVTPRDQSALC